MIGNQILNDKKKKSAQTGGYLISLSIKLGIITIYIYLPVKKQYIPFLKKTIYTMPK